MQNLKYFWIKKNLNTKIIDKLIDFCFLLSSYQYKIRKLNKCEYCDDNSHILIMQMVFG